MPDVDGGETMKIFLKIRPQSSSPENKNIYNTCRESLNHFNIIIITKHCN
jgi:hypothetical protein